MADFTFIDFFPDVANREYNDVFGDPLLNPTASVGLNHVVFAGVLVLGIIVLALIARRKYTDRERALIPDGKLTVANFFEVIFEGVINMMSDMMGEKNAKKFFPLIASLAVFIFIGNVMGLVVGLYPPTSNLNTALACAVVVFLVYNVAGVAEQGLVGYIKHFFMGPIFMAPVMFVIEMVSHAFRPISLSVRLGGNMTGDHIMLEIFGDLAAGMWQVPFLLPIPFMFLGLLVSIIQALIFCMLSSIYISLAVSHDDH